MSALDAVYGIQEWSGHATPLLGPFAQHSETLPTFGAPPPELQLRALLKETGFTITQLSAATRRLYGHSTSFFIPTTFLYKARAGITPHLYQIAALSGITGISFWQCMRTCGLDAQLISTVQLRLRRNQTVLLPPPIPVQTGNYCQFAKIGRADAEALPELSPDSIIGVNASCVNHLPPAVDQQSTVWLIEHERGIACCHLESAGRDHVRVLPSRPPFWGWPLEIGREIRILGEVDVDGLAGRGSPDPCAPHEWTSPPIYNCPSTFSRLLQVSRSRAGLTFRAAHDLSIQASHFLGPDYAIGIGALCDYEATDLLPRHVAKIFALCIIYCIDFKSVLQTVGIRILDSGKAQIDCSRSFDSRHHFLGKRRTVQVGIANTTLGRTQSIESVRDVHPHLG
jgi:hypothetical protein